MSVGRRDFGQPASMIITELCYGPGCIYNARDVTVTIVVDFCLMAKRISNGNATHAS